MTERGILFSAPMVRALLDGSKTQTRRGVKGIPLSWLEADLAPDFVALPENRACPYGQAGDRLWVRESCAGEELANGQDGVLYAADDAFIPIKDSPSAAINWLKLHTYGLKTGQRPDSLIGRKVPSIHMPRWASRILLEITSVRIERLQDISQDDAQAEGITDGGCVNCGEPEAKCACSFPMPDYRDAYCHLWESINGAGSWDANPWVWVVQFRRIEG